MNPYLEKLASMGKVFRRPSNPSGLPVKSLSKDMPQLTPPKRSVQSTEHRDQIIKQASMLVNGLKGARDISLGTGTALGKVIGVLSGKGPSSVAERALGQMHPSKTHAQMKDLLSRPDDEIRELLRHSPEHLNDFNREVNLRKASRAIALTGLGAAAIHKYTSGQNPQETTYYPY